MPRYLIERNVPGAHAMSQEELNAASEKSCDVLGELGADIQWQESFITEDRITCVYIARDPEIIREHARRSGIPAHQIHAIEARIDPTTAGR